VATTFPIATRALHRAGVESGVLPDGAEPPGDEEIGKQWSRERGFIEFLAAQPEARCWIAENGGEPVAYGRVVRLGAIEELSELYVAPGHEDRGLGRALLGRLWPGDPTPEVGRLVVATGAPADLSLYTRFGVMPVAGHWHMRQRTDEYLERRAQEVDAAEADVHVLTDERATAEWKRLEPAAIAHHRPQLHDHFGRDRTCLAHMGEDGAVALCWVSPSAEIGPAVGRTAEDVVPVVLAALDRVAKSQEPEHLSVFATTFSWWLLARMRKLGFRVWWPSWILCSVPLPGLDRYVPTRPPYLL
jgi:GNAT superfamily N-acetyltransferase